MARRGRRRRRCRRLQHLLLHAASYDGLAGGGWHAGPCIKVGGACRIWVQRRDRRVDRLSRRRRDSDPGRARTANAVCSYWLRRRGFHDSRRLLVQDGERRSAACRRLAYDIRTPERDNRRRLDRGYDHYSDELRAHRSKAYHRSPLREVDASELLNGRCQSNGGLDIGMYGMAAAIAAQSCWRPCEEDRRLRARTVPSSALACDREVSR